MEIVRPIIAKSWIRSREYGVDPTAELSKSVTFDISNRLKKSSALVNAARPPIIALNQMVRGTGFRMNLSDDEGYFLISEGEEESLAKLR